MAKESKYSWDASRILDEGLFDQEDHEAFEQLLHGVGGNGVESRNAQMTQGSLVRGRIVEIGKERVVIDVGLKSEGIVNVEEFSDPSELMLGAEVEVLLDQPEDESGQVVLSREKAERLRQWEYILDQCEEGSIVKGRVLRKVKGGLMVDIGMEAFLPGSQVDNKKIKNLDDYIGRTFEFKILKINIDRKNVVISRRALLEAERLSRKAELLHTIQEGEIRTGTVKNIVDFGVFLDLDGIDGLLHVSDMTWKRIKHPSEMVQLGQKLEVIVLNVDREKARVALGLKQKEANPWDQIEAKYPPGSRVRGKIVNLVSYGAFIEIETGIEGLIHISEMSWGRNIADPSEVVKKGQEVEAVVLQVQKEEGKISLGLKQTEPNPWDEVEKKYPPGTKVRGKVRALTNYAAFVELEPGIEGMIYISDLSWIKKVSHPSEMLNKGDLVDAVVLLIDKTTDKMKINLGLKQLTSNPWADLVDKIPVGSLIEGTVSKTTGVGALVNLDLGLEGVVVEGHVHVRELSDLPFGKVEDVVKVGDRITAKVVKVDPEQKRISLSIKEYLVDKNQFSRDDIVVGASREGGADEASMTSEEES